MTNTYDNAAAMLQAFWQHDGQVVSLQVAGFPGLVSGTVCMTSGRLPVLASGGTPIFLNPAHVIALIPGIVDIGHGIEPAVGDRPESVPDGVR